MINPADCSPCSLPFLYEGTLHFQCTTESPVKVSDYVNMLKTEVHCSAFSRLYYIISREGLRWWWRYVDRDKSTFWSQGNLLLRWLIDYYVDDQSTWYRATYLVDVQLRQNQTLEKQAGILIIGYFTLSSSNLSPPSSLQWSSTSTIRSAATPLVRCRVTLPTISSSPSLSDLLRDSPRRQN